MPKMAISKKQSVRALAKSRAEIDKLREFVEDLSRDNLRLRAAGRVAATVLLARARGIEKPESMLKAGYINPSAADAVFLGFVTGVMNCWHCDKPLDRDQEWHRTYQGFPTCDACRKGVKAHD